MPDAQRYKLTLAYRGTRYHGWQRQLRAGNASSGEPGDVTVEGDAGAEGGAAESAAAELPTIQNELRQALIRTLGHDVTVVGSSRTDAGVHALGQVAHFDTIRTQVAPERIMLALNAKLADDIRVDSIEAVPATFDAITSAREKAYRYVIHNASLKDVFGADLALHIPRPLDLAAMRAAAACLAGEHDFASFAKPGHGRETTIRTITAAGVRREGDDVLIEFTGGGFLWHQVRIMAGTLIQVGLGGRDPGTIPECLRARDRQKSGPTAPAHGLYLLWVRFGEMAPAARRGELRDGDA